MTRRARFGVGWSLLIVVAAAAVWAYPRPLRDRSPGERIAVITDAKPFHHAELGWTLEGNVYRSRRGTVPVDRVNALRQAVLASRERCDPLKEVGFKADWESLVEQTRQGRPWLKGEPPTIDLNQAAREAALSESIGDHPLAVELDLGGQPAIRLSGHTPDGALTLPIWRVQVEDLQWETRCTTLGNLILDLCPASGYETKLSTTDWTLEFYERQSLRLAEDWGRQIFQAESKTWPGYQELDATISEFTCRFDSNWAVSLERDDQVIHQAVIAFDPNQGLDWGQVKVELKGATEALAQQPWVKLPVRLTPCEDFGRQSWAAAKLEGEPAFGFEGNGQDFLLSRDGQVCLADCSAAEAIQTFGLSLEPSNAWYKVITDHGKARLAPRDPYVDEIESVKLE